MDKQERNEILLVVVVALGVVGMALSITLVSILGYHSVTVGIGSFAVVAGITYDWHSKRKRQYKTTP
jgi:hypothetical protein